MTTYKGKGTGIFVLCEHIDVPEGQEQTVYGVPCTHEIITVNGAEAHVLGAVVPESLAKEMVACGRAHLRTTAENTATV